MPWSSVYGRASDAPKCECVAENRSRSHVQQCKRLARHFVSFGGSAQMGMCNHHFETYQSGKPVRWIADPKDSR